MESQMTPKKQIKPYVAPMLDELIRFRTKIDPLKRSMSDVVSNLIVSSLIKDPLLPAEKRAMLQKLNLN